MLSQSLVQKKNGGFTLIETLVAVSIFVTVFSVGVGGFVAAMRTQRQLQALISANSNASLVIEQMAREIRTGLGFQAIPSADCASSVLPCQLGFVNAKNEQITYHLDAASQSLFRRSVSLNGLVVDVPITAENVAVQYLGFEILGECPSNAQSTDRPDHAPRITIVFGVSPKGERGVNNDVTEVQTAVTSRQGFTCIYPS